MKIILAVNAGSSSVKVSVYEIAVGHAEPKRVAEAQISGLTAPPPKLTYKRGGSDGADVTVRKDDSLGDNSISSNSKMGMQAAAFERILRELFEDEGLPQLSSKGDIAVVAHRIVHGGDAERPEHITTETLHKLEKLSDLAPLHNGPSLAIVRACMSSSSSPSSDDNGNELPSSPLAPDVVNVACFDTVFHASIPRHIRTYPVDQ
ncbi:acetate kinase, partial [Magnaporthiopsis poae ATCC 64411]